MTAEENKGGCPHSDSGPRGRLERAGQDGAVHGGVAGMGLRGDRVRQARAQMLVVGHNQARGEAAVEAIRGTGGSAQFLPAEMGDAAQVANWRPPCSPGAHRLLKSADIDALMSPGPAAPPMGGNQRGRY